jgi:hypothetical protein
MFDPRHALATLNPKYRFRSAVTGEFVSRLFALLHPDTTIREKTK